MQDLRATLYDGRVFTQFGVFVAVIPKDESSLASVMGLLLSLTDFQGNGPSRNLDQKLDDSRDQYLKAFRLIWNHWNAVADHQYPIRLA